jgi:tetratricopeptide (TPR) repeat protein
VAQLRLGPGSTIDTISHLLGIVALAAALGLAALAVIGLIVSVAQVTVRGRVFVIPFRAADMQRVDLTVLFSNRLVDMERRWRSLAHEIQMLRSSVGATSRDASLTENAVIRASADEGGGPSRHATTLQLAGSPITSGQRLLESLPRPGDSPFKDVAAGPRTTGDEVLDDVLLIAEENSMADIDFGSMTVSGVSFSLQAFVALFRRLPGVFARRVLHGAISPMGDGSVLSVTLDQRPLPGRFPRYRASCTVHVIGEDWIHGVDGAAFGLAKARIDQLRDAGLPAAAGAGAPKSTRSETVARAEIEAESWDACEAFLEGYAAQLRHYLSGRGSDRDTALDHYENALRFQSGYARAAYNRATLLYNKYLPAANREAIVRFREATSSTDPRVRALAYSGLAMAYCQARHRFDGAEDGLVSKAVDASQDALSLDPDLEEARFAVAWAYQALGDPERAVSEYESVVRLPTDTSAGRRIKSFALNNAGWIWMHEFEKRKGAVARAEAYFWTALQYYPNKIAYVNVADVARTAHRYDDAIGLFERALDLDPAYVNAWNERAMLEVEMAREAARGGRRKRADVLAADARLHHQRAIHLACDEAYEGRLRRDFEAAEAQYTQSLARGAAG